MSGGRICVRTVRTAEPGESIRAAAARMAEHGVGTVVVLDEGRVPIGILSDRDLPSFHYAGEKDVLRSATERASQRIVVGVYAQHYPAVQPLEVRKQASQHEGRFAYPRGADDG